jgi:hypothetical protein
MRNEEQGIRNWELGIGVTIEDVFLIETSILLEIPYVSLVPNFNS